MAKLILITGGTRSGKSFFAQQYGEEFDGSRCFVATAQGLDEEMRERIEKHRKERSTMRWTTLEEPIHLKKAIEGNKNHSLYLIDCLTLWISNLMDNSHQLNHSFGEGEVTREVSGLLDAIKSLNATFIFVTNEVGMGIVPDNKVARRYRDYVGLCNRLIAARAQEVILVSCGLPLYLKRID